MRSRSDDDQGGIGKRQPPSRLHNSAAGAPLSGKHESFGMNLIDMMKLSKTGDVHGRGKPLAEFPGQWALLSVPCLMLGLVADFLKLEA